jgi:hypothetical protein
MPHLRRAFPLLLVKPGMSISALSYGRRKGALLIAPCMLTLVIRTRSFWLWVGEGAGEFIDPLDLDMERKVMSCLMTSKPASPEIREVAPD